MKITDPKTLSTYLRDERRHRGLSQAKVGDSVGLRQGTVSKFESTPEKMQLDTLFRLLSALELELVVQPKGNTLNSESSASSTSSDKWAEEW
ncbi:MAG: HTH-type transcriptional regulator, antitoxin HipB [Idiomarina sp. T82-3]|jgi:HTH-type transcriptional regulator/antitoxin HipB|uniref:helix-turn-helix domain-containing protein n=1 Tax=Idiomarina TaxID=135575 RepID=UPI000798CBCE|nr:helix-turn-helix domain-containing protein [Idiomarina sp. T82-3]KXS33956.1 MAG: HTH-type transcriptional regulator, antitoxin HipB [Idiomarina sp. T82-3]